MTSCLQKITEHDKRGNRPGGQRGVAAANDEADDDVAGEP